MLFLDENAVFVSLHILGIMLPSAFLWWDQNDAILFGINTNEI